MIRRLTLKNFKRFREQSFELADSIVYEHFPPVAKVADVSDPRIEDLSDIPDAELETA